MYAVPRPWRWGLAGGLAAATATNIALSSVEVEHDPFLVLLIGLAAAAVVLLGLEALGDTPTLPWTVPVAPRRADDGEDLRTEELRWLVESHLSRRSTDEGVVWQLAELARRRVRQIHGPDVADDPALLVELVGPELAEWMSHDRRHRYDPSHRHPHHTLAQLAEALRRIEEL
jgi:hypothetical protein